MVVVILILEASSCPSISPCFMVEMIEDLVSASAVCMPFVLERVVISASLGSLERNDRGEQNGEIYIIIYKWGQTGRIEYIINP